MKGKNGLTIYMDGKATKEDLEQVEFLLKTIIELVNKRQPDIMDMDSTWEFYKDEE